MQPEDQSQNPYEFIMNPDQAPKKKKGLPGVKDPFLSKLILLIGGAVVIIILFVVVFSMIFKGKTINTADLVGVVQTQEELVRISSQGYKNAAQAEIRSLAITANLSIDTNRQQLLDYLKKNGHKVTTKELSLKYNKTTDTRLGTAIQQSTFDGVYVQIMQDSLVAYNTEIEETAKRATGTIEKQLLAQASATAQLLLKQVPSIESVQTTGD